MYIKKSQSWSRHADLIFLDVLCLHAAFTLAYMSRNGISNPYASDKYLTLAAVYTLVDVLVLLGNRSMKDVLKRGYYKELAYTFRHAMNVALWVSLFLFSVQTGEV